MENLSNVFLIKSERKKTHTLALVTGTLMFNVVVLLQTLNYIHTFHMN